MNKCSVCSLLTMIESLPFRVLSPMDRGLVLRFHEMKSQTHMILKKTARCDPPYLPGSAPLHAALF